jgi:2-polyprenyl-3-methyl-5-hydroxy-6-metoxy-1,4-benzoquinol methylase
MQPTEEQRLAESWDINAAAWTQSVREGLIRSRRLVTDQAITDAVLLRRPKCVLDAGCGEGWLARKLASHGISVTGFDGSEALIADAQQQGGGSFISLNYEDFCARPQVAGEHFDIVVFNFALLSENMAPILRAASEILAPGGCILIQTLHPVEASQGDRYENGWREERFAGMGEGYQAAMPWFFRTLGSWWEELRRAELECSAVEEPLHPETGRPASLLLSAVPRRQT